MSHFLSDDGESNYLIETFVVMTGELHRSFRRHGLQDADAEDAIQDVALRLCKAESTGVKSPKAYIWRTAWHILCDSTAPKSVRFVRMATEAFEAASQKAASEQNEVTELDVASLLQRLTPLESRVLTLGWDLPTEEIALQLGLSIGRVYQLRANAIRKLRRWSGVSAKRRTNRRARRPTREGERQDLAP